MTKIIHKRLAGHFKSLHVMIFKAKAFPKEVADQAKKMIVKCHPSVQWVYGVYRSPSLARAPPTRPVKSLHLVLSSHSW